MGLIEADELIKICRKGWKLFGGEDEKLKHWVDEADIRNQPTVKAIPIEVFYKMIHNALADTKKENWEPEECPYDYFDGNRNAIHCMLDILCGDKDGDHDDFWKEYMDWEEENDSNNTI